ncbi:helix-turn-helix domain-containing protein [Winogradskyella sp. 3972H.M.0a.05]|uniref:helix-turn-helix domain-containing protein n=1 Tax=Winogradskyella sp. 3972H.M.0a.05 TaxID=2950277 RepID=UPI00339186CF
MEFIYFIAVYVQSLSWRQEFYGIHWNYIEPTLEVIALISFITYLYFSLKALKKYKLEIDQNYSDTTIEKYEWLKKLLIILIIFTIIWGILTIVDVFIMGYSLGYIYFYPYYLFIAFIGYFISFSLDHLSRKRIPIHFQKTTSKALISEEKTKTVLDNLDRLMREEKLYLKGDLRSKDVSDKLGITVQTLSYAINKGLKNSFNDYINKLRVLHVKERLEAGDLEKKNLAGIAKESGFNSESSFYRIFKKVAGVTPKEYLK